MINNIIDNIREDDLVWQENCGVGDDFYNILSYQLKLQGICPLTYTTQNLRYDIVQRIKRYWHHYKNKICRKQSIQDFNTYGRDLYCTGIMLASNKFVDLLDFSAMADHFNLKLIIKYKGSSKKIMISAEHLPSFIKSSTMYIGYDQSKECYVALVAPQDIIRFQSLVAEELIAQRSCCGMFAKLSLGYDNICEFWSKLRSKFRDLQLAWRPYTRLNNEEKMARSCSLLFDEAGGECRVLYRKLLTMNLTEEQQINRFLKYIKINNLICNENITLEKTIQLYKAAEKQILNNNSAFKVAEQVQHNFRHAIKKINQIEDNVDFTIAEDDYRLTILRSSVAKTMVQISKNNNEISIDTLEKKRKLMHLVLKSKALGKGTTLSPTKSFNFHYVTRQLDKLSLIDNRVPDLGGSKSNRLRYR